MSQNIMSLHYISKNFNSKKLYIYIYIYIYNLFELKFLLI